MPGAAAAPDRAGRGAAFFDLDSTLIRRSSMLALAPTLRRHGLIGWRSLARASVWHAVYLIRGVSSRELSQVAEQTFKLVRGWPIEELRALIADQIEPLAALAFPDAISRMRAHQERGEGAIVVSSSLQDLVEPLASRLGLDGAVASQAEIRDGRDTRGFRDVSSRRARPVQCAATPPRTPSTSPRRAPTPIRVPTSSCCKLSGTRSP
jgi:phosphoserine phosphatase